MKCVKCGQEIPDGKFCPFCGTAQDILAASPSGSDVTNADGESNDVENATVLSSQTQEEERIEKTVETPMKAVEAFAKAADKKKSASNRGLIIVGVAAVVLIALFLIFKKDPVSKYMSLQESGDYAKANSIYDTKIAGNIDSEKEVSEYLTEILYDSWQAYLNGDGNPEELNKTLDELHKVKAGEAIESEITKIENSYRRIKDSNVHFLAGQKKQAAGEPLEALDEYQKVSKEDPFHYDDAQKAIEEIKDAYREETLTYIEDSKASENYVTALALIDKALKVLVDDEVLLNAKDEVVALKEQKNTQDMLKSVEELRNKGEIKQALKEIKSYKGNDAKVIATKAQIESEYETLVDSSVKELIKAKDIDAAKKMINDSKSLYPTSEIISEWASKIDEYYPVSLLDLNQFTSQKDPGNFYFKDNWVAGKDHDNMGNTEYVGLVYEVCYRNLATGATITYLLDGKYDTFSGVWAIKDVSKDQVEERHRAVLSVYGDGACLYTSPIIRGGVKPVEFEVDISGVEELVLRIDATGGLYFGLLNPELTKSIE